MRETERGLYTRSEQLQARQILRVDHSNRHFLVINYDKIVGKSTAMQKVFKLLDKITDTDVPVLIQGETGTGKTTIARWLHRHGPRAAQPLVEVNCSALPETLAESELFGHERGAFTDARAARMGLFEAANGGTLLLDEFTEMTVVSNVSACLNG